MHLLLRKLSLYEHPDVKEELERIMKAPEYSELQRLQCEYLREQRFGKSADIGLRTKLDGVFDEGYPPPMPFRVFLTNNRDEPLHLKFASISEILGFWVTESQNQAIVKPKTGVQWFVAADSSKQAPVVVIGSGETRELTINLLDYFDFSTLEDRYVTVRVRCKIPGIHELPFVSSTGHGALIRKEIQTRE